MKGGKMLGEYPDDITDAGAVSLDRGEYIMVRLRWDI